LETVRRLILKMSMSINGFVAGPNGGIDWSIRSRDEGGKAWVAEMLCDGEPSVCRLCGLLTDLDRPARGADERYAKSRKAWRGWAWSTNTDWWSIP
jgi:hypothetical protein